MAALHSSISFKLSNLASVTVTAQATVEWNLLRNSFKVGLNQKYVPEGS